MQNFDSTFAFNNQTSGRKAYFLFGMSCVPVSTHRQFILRELPFPFSPSKKVLV